MSHRSASSAGRAPMVLVFTSGNKLFVNERAWIPDVIQALSQQRDVGPVGPVARSADLFDIYSAASSPRSLASRTTTTQCASEYLVGSGAQCDPVNESVETCTQTINEVSASSTQTEADTHVPPVLIDSGMMTCEDVISLEEASRLLDIKVAPLTENMLDLGVQRDLLTAQLADANQQLALVKGQLNTLNRRLISESGRWADQPVPADAAHTDDECMSDVSLIELPCKHQCENETTSRKNPKSNKKKNGHKKS
eukprot:TRINITY_DN28564_c0_g1_i4.p1 TRINITY_DN28564_c0_g1~~TRINITY_DN28564_c0_g1_i4.p1  ORF type:complete len:273 (-),score=10.41 TRINITY_DN28564_c0_g1_i4:390-1148(-)